MNRIRIALAIILASFGLAAFAQGTTATGSSVAGASATTAPVVFNPVIEASQPLARTEVKQEIKSYTAPSAPTAYGAVGGAGCPAIDSVSGSVFFFNGSKATPVELAGCMGLQLAALMKSLIADKLLLDDGSITIMGANILEGQCDFPQYKGALGRMVFKLGGKNWSCGATQSISVAIVSTAVAAPVAVAPTPAAPVAPAASTSRYSADPRIADYQRKAGL